MTRLASRAARGACLPWVRAAGRLRWGIAAALVLALAHAIALGQGHSHGAGDPDAPAQLLEHSAQDEPGAQGAACPICRLHAAGAPLQPGRSAVPTGKDTRQALATPRAGAGHFPARWPALASRAPPRAAV